MSGRRRAPGRPAKGAPVRAPPRRGALCLTPLTALAVPPDPPPAPTETTTRCTGGTVRGPESEACVAPDSARLDDAARDRAARVLAHGGRPDAARRVLDAMEDEASDRVLTYRGFATRKAGDVAGGLAWYRVALAANPDNLRARAYMGQALADRGDTVAARAQLSRTRARGGRGTWPEIALRLTLESGGSGY